MTNGDLVLVDFGHYFAKSEEGGGRGMGLGRGPLLDK